MDGGGVVSLFGPNGQPVAVLKEVVEVQCGGCALKVFKDPKEAVPIQLIQGQETQAFIEVIQRINAYNVYVNAMVREFGSLQARIAELEAAAKAPDAPSPP